MKKRGVISDAVGLLGIALMLGPWLILDKPSWGAYACTLFGIMLGGLARADALSDMLGRGNPGDEFIRDSLLRLKSWFLNRKEK